MTCVAALGSGEARTQSCFRLGPSGSAAPLRGGGASAWGRGRRLGAQRGRKRERKWRGARTAAVAGGEARGGRGLGGKWRRLGPGPADPALAAARPWGAQSGQPTRRGSLSALRPSRARPGSLGVRAAALRAGTWPRGALCRWELGLGTEALEELKAAPGHVRTACQNPGLSGRTRPGPPSPDLPTLTQDGARPSGGREAAVPLFLPSSTGLLAGSLVSCSIVRDVWE